MLKYSVKEYFFRATLCHLCIDILDASRALERYIEMYPAFQDSREYKLLKVMNRTRYRHENVVMYVVSK